MEGDRKGAEFHLPDNCGWMAGWSPLLSSCAWMVSTTRLKRLLGPDGMKIIPEKIQTKDQVRVAANGITTNLEPFNSFQR